MTRTFDHDDFQFGLEVALNASYRQAADVGEVLCSASRIQDGNPDSWVDEWALIAGLVWSTALEAERRGRGISALAHYRRAATYYATALYRTEHSTEPERGAELWRRQRLCWDRVVDLSRPRGERISIPYEHTTLPGYVFRAPGSEPGERRPFVIINNGSDGATSRMWVHGGAAASEHGYHWMTFDGPGQQAALHEQGIPFRPDWEAVLTPVLDTVLDRPDVDSARVAVIGVGQAGYWVPRALAFEHRFAAAVVDPGVVDVSTSWVEPLSEMMREHLREGARAAFDREMRLATLMSPDTAATLRFRGQPYGVADGSMFALYRTVERYRLGEELDQVKTPLLITDPEDEHFWPGQSRQLYARLNGAKKLVQFRSADGAGRHCEPIACAARDALIFDWLSYYLDQSPISGQFAQPQSGDIRSTHRSTPAPDWAADRPQSGWPSR